MENTTNIKGKKIKDVVLGYQRNYGSFEDEKNGKKVIVNYDNVVLYTAPCFFDYNDPDRGLIADGFCGSSAKNPMITATKIKYEDFESVFGFTYNEFVRDFGSSYQFHFARILYGLSDFGDPVPIQVIFGEQDIYSMVSMPDVPLKEGQKTAEIK